MVESPPKTQEQINQERLFNERMAQLKGQNEQKKAQEDLKYEQAQELKQKELESSGLGGIIALPIALVAGILPKSKEADAKNAIMAERARLLQEFDQQQKITEKKTREETIVKFTQENPNASPAEVNTHVQKEMAKYQLNAGENKAIFKSNLHNKAYQNYQNNLLEKDPSGRQLEAFHKLEVNKPSFQKWQAGMVQGDIDSSKNTLFQVHAERQITQTDPNSRTKILAEIGVKEKNLLGMKVSDAKLAGQMVSKKEFLNNPVNQAVITNKLQPALQQWENHPYIVNKNSNRQGLPVIQHKPLTIDERSRFNQLLEKQRTMLIQRHPKISSIPLSTRIINAINGIGGKTPTQSFTKTFFPRLNYGSNVPLVRSTGIVPRIGMVDRINSLIAGIGGGRQNLRLGAAAIAENVKKALSKFIPFSSLSPKGVIKSLLFRLIIIPISSLIIATLAFVLGLLGLQSQ